MDGITGEIGSKMALRRKSRCSMDMHMDKAKRKN
jgi:hypothetical protein